MELQISLSSRRPAGFDTSFDSFALDHTLNHILGVKFDDIKGRHPDDPIKFMRNTAHSLTVAIEGGYRRLNFDVVSAVRLGQKLYSGYKSAVLSFSGTEYHLDFGAADAKQQILRMVNEAYAAETSGSAGKKFTPFPLK